MRRPVTATFLILVLTLMTHVLSANAQLCPPRDGVELPPVMREVLQRDPSAYSWERAWKGVAERAAAVRDAVPDGSMARIQGSAVEGPFRIPVFAIDFNDSAAEPWATSALEQELFDGQGASLTDFYDEISGGRMSVTGDVMGWTTLSQDKSYYEGTSNGLDPRDAKVGELILETITAHDAVTDFGLYDNDGPDGLPNSGDDDGYVDFVAFVHPDFGGECGGATNSNIWSHRWRYPAWGASNGYPLSTNDPAAGGGTIKIDDYVIQPGLACGGAEMIQIGVFCHEFGHAFGLPDLYDVNGGGGNGLGAWCLMAAGNWNQPDSPAHMSAWTAAQLGWVDVVDVGPEVHAQTVEPVFDSRTVYRLPFEHDRWRVRDDCAIEGTGSLVVGATAEESAARGWAAPKGYGNNWFETVAHDFHYDGNGPVTLSYDYAIDVEDAYDFVFVLLEVDGVESTLKVHDGQDSGSEAISLQPDLGGQATDYRIKFRLRSDGGWSNEDGSFVSSCAAFALDGVSVSGGGENHTADFEEHRDGWYGPRNEDDNPTREYWLVENRRRRGFDVHLKAEGLMIYHVDDDVMNSALGNSGGADDIAARGVVIEEADGIYNLLGLDSTNRGDAGDPWPGNGSSFGPLTTPGTTGNDGMATGVDIVSMIGDGDAVDVVWRAGNPAPTITGVLPADGFVEDGPLVVSLEGATGVEHGAHVRMVAAGQPALEPTSVTWLDFDRVEALFDPSLADVGVWDVVVENPNGLNATVVEGFRWKTSQLTSAPDGGRLPSAFALERNVPNPFNPRTTLRFNVPEPGRVNLRVFDARGRLVATLVDAVRDAGFHQVVWDGRDASGGKVASGVYFARMTAADFVQTQKMLLAQ